jgi:hypothetical protein
VEAAVARRAERRRFVRLRSVDQHRIIAVRVRPGLTARIVDVSAAGIAIETAQRLLPGSAIEMQVDTSNERVFVRGRVIRCRVCRLTAEAISYDGAIVFDRQLAWIVDVTDDGYRVLDRGTRR